MIKQLIPIKIKDTINNSINPFLFRWKKYHCPICGYNSNSLTSIGGDYSVLREKEVVGAGKRNGGCPKCKSSDRERLVFTFLKNKLDLLKNKNLKILHLAPENNISLILSKIGFNKYICGDLFTEGYQYPEYVQNMNVLNIPFEDNYFDLIICNHLLEHVPNDIDAMRELYRALSKNGKAILQVPISKNSAITFEDYSVIDPKERETVFGQFDHVRIYGQDYSDRLKSVGFIVDRINISAEFPKHGLASDEDIFIGKK